MNRYILAWFVVFVQLALVAAQIEIDVLQEVKSCGCQGPCQHGDGRNDEIPPTTPETTCITGVSPPAPDVRLVQEDMHFVVFTGFRPNAAAGDECEGPSTLWTDGMQDTLPSFLCDNGIERAWVGLTLSDGNYHMGSSPALTVNGNPTDECFAFKSTDNSFEHYPCDEQLPIICRE